MHVFGSGGDRMQFFIRQGDRPAATPATKSTHQHVFDADLRSTTNATRRDHFTPTIASTISLEAL
jgi:hypothetical protein